MVRSREREHNSAVAVDWYLSEMERPGIPAVRVESKLQPAGV
jgi:hypothetical protein